MPLPSRMTLTLPPSPVSLISPLVCGHGLAHDAGRGRPRRRRPAARRATASSRNSDPSGTPRRGHPARLGHPPPTTSQAPTTDRERRPPGGARFPAGARPDRFPLDDLTRSLLIGSVGAPRGGRRGPPLGALRAPLAAHLPRHRAGARRGRARHPFDNAAAHPGPRLRGPRAHPHRGWPHARGGSGIRRSVAPGRGAVDRRASACRCSSSAVAARYVLGLDWNDRPARRRHPVARPTPPRCSRCCAGAAAPPAHAGCSRRSRGSTTPRSVILVVALAAERRPAAEHRSVVVPPARGRRRAGRRCRDRTRRRLGRRLAAAAGRRGVLGSVLHRGRRA